MSRRKWMLLFRWEEGRRVYIYEPLRKHELEKRLLKGWKLDMGG